MPRKKIVPFETDCDKWWLKENGYVRTESKYIANNQDEIDTNEVNLLLYAFGGIMLTFLFVLTLLFGNLLFRNM